MKIDATTINPSDRYLIAGQYSRPPPAIAGIEGTGKVIKAQGENVQSWVGKRVCFITTGSGTWASYCVTSTKMTFEIDEDVELNSAASGVVNPLTVIGMIEILRERKLNGLIHTAAASSLGRMLNKLCKKEGIPLLNIVRREEQANVLKAEGAENVLITTGDWEPQFKEYTNKGFDCIFDALGGGETTKVLLENMPLKSGIFLYGTLEGKPLIFDAVQKIQMGLKIEGYIVGIWWAQAAEEIKTRVRAKYSEYLKGELSTKLLKELKFAEIKEAMELSVSRTLEGKVLMKPE